MSRNVKHVIALVVILVLVLATGCVPAPGSAPLPSPGGTRPPPTTDQGTIEIRVTDPPPAEVESAVVYLNNIEVHRASDNASQWLRIADAPPSFDLLDVVGISQALAERIADTLSTD